MPYLPLGQKQVRSLACVGRWKRKSSRGSPRSQEVEREIFWLIIHRCLSCGIMHSYMSLLRFLFVIYGVCLKVLGYNPGTAWQNREAFAALKEDGTVMAWGNSGFGGNDVPLGLNYVNVIYYIFYAANRGMRIYCDSSFYSAMFNFINSSMKMITSFNMYS